MLNLDGLNEKQIEAVTSIDGYFRVIAGAGSGKTKALTHRYAYLVGEAGIPPRNILCVTFTNKAACEMKKRVKALVGKDCDTSLITTYHGFCARVLREDISGLFYPENFLILDTPDQKVILSEIYDRLNISLDFASYEDICLAIDIYKDDQSYVDYLVDPKAEIHPEKAKSLKEKIILNYLIGQKKIFGLDFNDLMYFTFALFKKKPEIKQKWQEQIQYILVDEFQDCSKREYRLINILSEVNKNLFVVGDPDQTIYGWRGADMKIIMDFDKKYPKTKTIMLNQNYRSTPEIIATANSLIANNKIRIEKELFSKLEPGVLPEHLHATDEKSEAEGIIKRIKALLNEGYRYSDIAILYRAAYVSRFIEQYFTKEGIPFEIFGSLRFFERMEIKDALAFLRLAAFGDDISFLRIINKPRRRMGKPKVVYLKELAAAHGGTLYENLKNHLGDEIFANTGAAQFVTLIEELRAKVDSVNPSVLLQLALLKSGYEEFIRKDGDMDRLDNIAELKRTVEVYQENYGEFLPLKVFLQQIAVGFDNEADDKRNFIKLMTIHAAKGLEFPAVFVCGMTEGIFPSSRTIEEWFQAGLEEERRLFYVAITRAKNKLYLTESEGIGANNQKTPSRFLFEINENLYTRTGRIPEELIRKTKKKAGISNKAETQTYQVGSSVLHPLFGEGIIESIDDKYKVYNVRFKKNGAIKSIRFDYVGLSQINNDTSSRLEESFLNFNL
ncbi:MAG: UvrD-helicase domain-containing protein [Eubacteriales bacterium]|nr:UvrD-helicase domain-containing protein [Eubacteriales bacterium]MDD4474344.1 UvrD-helicase domain-containing protein [Eubacteriales bacterium]